MNSYQCQCRCGCTYTPDAVPQLYSPPEDRFCLECAHAYLDDYDVEHGPWVTEERLNALRSM